MTDIGNIDALADYQKVTSIHVYSLSPHPQKDLSLLSDLSTQVLEYKTKEDSIVMAKKYGIIVNPQVRRRDRKGRAPAPAPAPTVTKPTVKQEPSKPAAVKNAKPEPAAKASFFAPKLKQETSDASSKDSTPASSAPGQKKSAPPLKRGDSGSIMQSFAKAKPPKPKPEPKKEEDTAMALSDDGEAGDDDMPISKKPAVDTDSIRKAKKEREEALRKMMEEDDDEEEEVPSEKDDEEMEEAPEPEPEPQSEEKKEEPAEVVSSTGNGRRRGKRRVMQKKRILDDQGYMGALPFKFYFYASTTNSFISHDPRTRLGIVFGRRGSSSIEKASSNTISLIICSEGQEACRQGPREHHVFLQQKVNSALIRYLATLGVLICSNQ